MAGAPLELIAVEVRADLDQLQAQMPAAARVVDQSMTAVERSVVHAEQQIVRSGARMGQGFDSAAMRSRLLGYQISDIGTQLASGSSPFLIMAQQAPQVANALEGTTGAAGRMAAFFSGPWGAALLAAASIAGVLIGKLWETDDALDSVEKGARSAIAALNGLGKASVGSQIAQATGELSRLQEQEQKLTSRINDPHLPFTRGTDTQARFRVRQQILEVENAINQGNRQLEEQAARAATAPATSSGGGGASRASRGSRGPSEAERARQQQERETAALNDRYNKTKAQLELEQELADLRARGTAEASKLADIREANFRIEQQFPELAASTNAADLQRLATLKLIAAATIEEAYGRKAAKDAMDEWFEAAEKRQQDLARGREKSERELAHKQADQIRTLAGLYHDAFTGGTKAIWDDFKQIGLSIIAEVLARFTVAQFNGGTSAAGGIGAILGQAITAVLPGFASGGSMTIGGRGGTDRNTLSLNGRPIAKVSAGETLSVTNPRLSHGGGGATVISSPQFDLRGAVVTAELYADMERISRANAAEAGTRAYRQSMKDAPSAMQRAQRYGR